MNQTFKINTKHQNKSRKTILVLVIVPFALLAALLVFYFGTRPIFDALDKDKYTTLDRQMRALYDQVNATAGTNDTWKYAAVCSEKHSGDWPLGIYDCITSISLQKKVTSAQEVKALHDKYFPIIENSAQLVPEPNVALDSTPGFGTEFKVSLASRNYTEEKTGTVCTYESHVNQEDDKKNYQTNNYRLGSDILGNKADFLISIRCDGIDAKKSWYPETDSTSYLIP